MCHKTAMTNHFHNTRKKATWMQSINAELHTRTSLLFSQQYLVHVVYNAMLLKHFKDNKSELELVILKANQPKSARFNSDLTQSSLTAFTELGLNQ